MFRRNRVPGTLPLFLLATVALGACNRSEAAEDTDSARASREEPAPEAVMVPAGASMTFVVSQAVSTDDNKEGDRFSSTLAANVTGSNGEVVLDAGSTGRWIVTRSTNDNGDGEAVLAVRLESVNEQGQNYPVQATVVSTDIQKEAKDSNAETAAKIGLGAAAGAVAGRLIGHDGGDALKGAGVGAAVGTAIALTTRSGSARIEKGAHITVRLDEPLRLTSN